MSFEGLETHQHGIALTLCSCRHMVRLLRKTEGVHAPSCGCTMSEFGYLPSEIVSICDLLRTYDPRGVTIADVQTHQRILSDIYDMLVDTLETIKKPHGASTGTYGSIVSSSSSVSVSSEHTATSSVSVSSEHTATSSVSLTQKRDTRSILHEDTKLVMFWGALYAAYKVVTIVFAPPK